jgi:hypothetical protein
MREKKVADKAQRERERGAELLRRRQVRCALHDPPGWKLCISEIYIGAAEGSPALQRVVTARA